MKRFCFVLLVCICTLSSYGQVCNGPVTLKSQELVNKFECTSFNGDLIIDDSGSGDITSLEAIFEGGMNDGNEIEGNLIIRNCPGLTHLTGLRGIGAISGDVRIINCPGLETMGLEIFNLKVVEGQFRIINCPSLGSIEALSSLSAIGSFTLSGDTKIPSFKDLDGMEKCGGVDISDTNLKEIVGFQSIKDMSGLILKNNSELQAVTGFNNLQSIVEGPAFGGNSGELSITNNPVLKDISGLRSLVETPNVDIQIVGNDNLSECCELLDALTSGADAIDISGNDSGCNSQAQIDASPVLGSCPAAITASTSLGSCMANISISHPSASDNCDFSNLRIVISPTAGGTIINQIVTGNSSSHNLASGDHAVIFTATDDHNNTTSCSTSITVEDNEKPVISGIPANVTINCDDNFPSVPTPTFTDNCDNDLELTASGSTSMGNCEFGQPAEIQSYTWTATDDAGNVASANWQVTVISDFSFDLGGPMSVCGVNSVILNPGNIGSSYQWSNGATTQTINVNSSGNYSVTVTSNNGCCYADDVMVTFETPPSANATGGELSCDATSIQIMGSSTSSGVTYSWTGPGGFTSTQQNPSVMEVGTYTLTVSKGAGCFTTATAVVTADTNVPDAAVTGGTITCDDASVQLMGSSASAGVSYSWTGPGGFTSSQQNPTVSTAGEYILTVSSGNGCSAMAVAQVADDTDAPDINLQNETIDCANPTVTYNAMGDVSWSGPGGFSSTANTVTLSEGGSYSIEVTADNGCTATDNFTISGDFSEPNISASGGALGCTVSSINLTGSSTTPGASFQWTGPGGFSSTLANPSVSSPGTYTLTVTGPNGCASSQTVQVTSGDDAPVLSSSGGILNCTITSIELVVSSDQNGVTFQWSGPGGFSEMGNAVTISDPGTYTITGTNSDGCAGTTSVEVLNNADLPDVDINAEELNCASESVTFSTTTFSDIESYNWSGPNGFFSDEKEPEVSDPGLYTLVTTGSNGCQATDTYEITIDGEVPDAMAEGGVLTCTENFTTISGSSSSENIMFLWQGPDGYSSTEQNPTVSVVGTYYLNVIAENGCVGIDSAMVEGDSDLPTISATGGTIDCINETVTLVGSTTSEGVDIMWQGPDGFQTTDPTPTVDVPGTYTFTVSRSGSCTVFSPVEVILDNRDPDILLFEGPINCEGGTRVFNVSTNALDGDFSWTGPDGYTSNTPNPVYSKAGTYNLFLMAPNGCSAEASITIEHDIGYEANLIIEGNDVTLEILGGTPPFDIVYNNSINGATVMNLSDGAHFVNITDGLGCQKLLNFEVNTTSTQDILDPNGIVLKPNPVYDRLNLEWKELSDKVSKVQIIDVSGKLVMSRNVAGSSVTLDNMGALKSGVYFVRFQGEKSIMVKKFLKQ